MTPGDGFTIYLGRYSRLDDTIEVVEQTVSDTSGSFFFDPVVPTSDAPGFAKSYDLIALDPTGQQFGLTGGVVVPAGITTAITVVLENTGAVKGKVAYFNFLLDVTPECDGES